jgi:hypothetical protein
MLEQIDRGERSIQSVAAILRRSLDGGRSLFCNLM